MLRVLLFEPDTATLETGGEELLASWRNSNKLLWLDALDEETWRERDLLTSFGIHPMAIQDAQRDRHPPKFETFSDYYFLLLKGLSAHSSELNFETIQIAMFVGERFMVTTHKDDSRSINSLWDQILATPATLGKGVQVLPSIIARNIVNRYLTMLMTVEANLDQLEHQMLQSDPTNVQLAQLTTYKTRLRVMSRVFNYHEQIFAELKSNPMVTLQDKLRHEFNDAYEHLERADSLARLYYDLANDLINSSISLASHRLNGIMKVLTIVTSIFIPLGFLAGLYGMNFENIPELRHENGYFYLLGAMATVALVLLALFRYRKWL